MTLTIYLLAGAILLITITLIVVLVYYNTNMSHNNDPVVRRPVGILRIDYEYPVSPGDVDSSDSYIYPIESYTIKGLTFEKAQAGYWDEELTSLLNDGLHYLVNKGVCGITGDCGFMMYYQKRIADLSPVPVMMSSLMQLPTILSSIKTENKVMILTANDEALTRVALENMLVDNSIYSEDSIEAVMSRIVIIGCQNVIGFEAVANGSKVEYDVTVNGIVELVQTYLEANPDVRAILSECTELGMFSDDLRYRLSHPVFDSITFIDFMWTASADNPKFGLTF